MLDLNKTKISYINGYVYNTEKSDFYKVNILTEDGVIIALKETDFSDADMTVDLCGKFVLPGLIDIHTHGRAGFDFEEISSQSLKTVLHSYAENGTTTVVPTLASATVESLVDSIKTIKNTDISAGEANVDTIHIEGRYLAHSKRGAHAPELLTLPSTEELALLLDEIEPYRAHVVVAPELEGSEKFIRFAVSKGATVSIAHTDATYEQSLKALEWGASAFTHTFNAMRPLNHREPGTVGASLLSDNAYSEFICDGFHIHPDVIRLASKVKAKDKLILVTDSLSAAGCPDGKYSVAGIPVNVVNGKAINDEGAIAGSTISLIDGLRNFIRFTGEKLTDAIKYATCNPAMLLNIYDRCGEIAVGKRADFIVTSDLDKLTLDDVILRGQSIK